MSEVTNKSYANMPTYYGDPEWLIHDRFGLFIHWGLYSLAARHEWVMTNERIKQETYQKYFKHFEPDLFDPRSWAKAAKNAGMKYVVFTTKHHEGFSLWDSKLTDYKVTNTPVNRDLLQEIVDAFRHEGLKIGFYHSLIDWHHHEFPIDGLHPQRDDEDYKKDAEGRDIKKYQEFLHGQVRELLTDYGKIDYLWFDFSYPNMKWDFAQGKGADEWQSKKLEKMIFDLQPDIILNDRLGLDQGVTTPEQYQPAEAPHKEGKPVVWEACQTLNESWGYDRDNHNWKSVGMLIKMLVDSVAKNGNLLLNVGPNGRGEMDAYALGTLEGMGNWMRLHARSIYGAMGSNYTAPADCRYTQKGNRLYLHIFSWPFKHIHLHGLVGKIEYAQFLHDASEVKFKEHNPDGAKEHSHMDADIAQETVVLTVPVRKPDTVVSVIEIFLK